MQTTLLKKSKKNNKIYALDDTSRSGSLSFSLFLLFLTKSEVFSLIISLSMIKQAIFHLFVQVSPLVVQSGSVLRDQSKNLLHQVLVPWLSSRYAPCLPSDKFGHNGEWFIVLSAISFLSIITSTNSVASIYLKFRRQTQLFSHKLFHFRLSLIL